MMRIFTSFFSFQILLLKFYVSFVWLLRNCVKKEREEKKKKVSRADFHKGKSKSLISCILVYLWKENMIFKLFFSKFSFLTRKLFCYCCVV